MASPRRARQPASKQLTGMVFLRAWCVCGGNIVTESDRWGVRIFCLSCSREFSTTKEGKLIPVRRAPSDTEQVEAKTKPNVLATIRQHTKEDAK